MANLGRKGSTFHIRFRYAGRAYKRRGPTYLVLHHRRARDRFTKPSVSAIG
jgi:hypothetical protein